MHCVSPSVRPPGVDKIITDPDDPTQSNTLPEQDDDTCLRSVIAADTRDMEAIMGGIETC